jgi:hypothetical protein
MLALAFVLAVVAVITLLIITSITNYNTKVMVEPARVRGFKGDELRTEITLVFPRSRWINVKLSSVKGEPGVETKFKTQSNGVTTVFLSSKYSGSFSGLKLDLEIVDILNLFSKQIQAVYAGFVFESLPLSILIQIPHAKPMPLILGERSGRTPGSSLELHALDNYQPFTEIKNIMWKRVARMPDEKLIVRIRDSSIPKVVRIGFIETKARREQAKLSWKDLACEAIGLIGNSLLASGCYVEIIQTSQQQEKFNQTLIHEVSEIDELSNAIMRLSDPPNLGKDMENVFQVLERADLVVCGMRELEDKLLSIPISKKPTLAVVEERTTPIVIGQQTLLYSGVEDVRKLVAKILEV